MKEIICLVGISGSGKSTLARKMQEELGDKCIIVNRDKIRELLFGYTEENISEYYKSSLMSSREKQVTETAKLITNQFLAENKTVILDNTHLKKTYIEELKKFNVPIRVIVIDVTLDVAIERDAARVRKVGEAVIRKQWKDFTNIKSQLKEADMTWEPSP